MAVSVAVSWAMYALVFGGWLAAGIIAVLAVHEVGHMAAARTVGLMAAKPVFIPFLGAVVVLRQRPPHVVAEAAVALGGPAAGILGSLLLLSVYWWTGERDWLLLAYGSCLLNLLNLLPYSPLDGGKIVMALPHWLRCGSQMLAGAALWYTDNLWLLGLAIGSWLYSWWPQRQTEPYRVVRGTGWFFGGWYMLLLGLLGGLTLYVGRWFV